MKETRVLAKCGSVCCIIGAGYSSVAGIPLTSHLLDENVHVASRSAKARFEGVWRDFDIWRKENSLASVEEYLRDLYMGNRGALSPPFTWAVELIGAVLSTPRSQDSGLVNPRYAVRLTRPLRCALHEAFWTCIISRFESISAVTTNYDVLTERCLRHRRMARSSMPGFFYGGLPVPQLAEGVALPWKTEDRMRVIRLEGSVPLMKVHGSLNWSVRLGEILIYQDARAAFRRGGDAAIVPPTPEKQIPPWLQPVWTEAEQHLAYADSWVICGYSLPQYDIAMREMLSRAAAGKRKSLFLLDPVSERLGPRWQEVAPQAEIECLPGLPAGIAQLIDRI
jgi:hypothetical protein